MPLVAGVFLVRKTLPTIDAISVAPPASSPALSRYASALRLRFARLSAFAPLTMTDVRWSGFYHHSTTD